MPPGFLRNKGGRIPESKPLRSLKDAAGPLDVVEEPS